MRVERTIRVTERVSIIAILALCLSVACNHNQESVASDTLSDGDSLFEYYEQTDTTSAEVAAWLERVSIDSAERLISRHDGMVVLDGKKHKVWIRDILRCCPQEAMEYPFKELVDSLYYIIRYSEDGSLRFFSWNIGMGGTSPDIALDILHREDNGTVVYVDNDCAVGGLYFETHPLKTDDGETLYLFHLTNHEWGTFAYEAVELYRLNERKLESTEYFSKYRLVVEYDIPCYNEGMKIDVNGNDIYIPVYEYDESNQSNDYHDRYLLYRWNGHGLDSLGNTGNRHLHTSLRDYKEFIKSVFTKNTHVRIDKMNDGSYRYASWNRYKSPSDKPNLIIYEGICDENNGNYVFENNGYTYIVGTTPKRYSKKHMTDYGIIVIKDDSVVFCQDVENLIIY